MTVEAQVEGTVCNIAQKAGWLTRKVRWIGRTGAPDRLFAKDGRIVLVEFKRPGKTARPLQAREHKKFAEVGVRVHVIDDINDGLRLLGLM